MIKSSLGYENKEITEDAFEVRRTVFVEEQGFALEIEIDDEDKKALHIVGYLESVPVAVSRLILKNNEVIKIGRVAVKKSHRKQNLGKQIMDYIEHYAHSNHFKKLSLSSQYSAKSFYEKSGYQAIGEPYDEEGVKHILMEKQLMKESLL